MGGEKMYNPCFECMNKYGRQYTEECDSKCEYANAISKLKPYGGIDEAVSVMRGEKIPIAMIDKDHIEDTFRIVNAAKVGII